MGYDQQLAAVWLSLEIAVVYVFGLAIYRLYWHPLSKIPGPKHFAVSGIPQAIDNQIKGHFNRNVLKLHEKYGEIVRTGPNHLSVSGSIGWREVFGHTRAGQAEFGHWKDFYQLGDKNVQSIVTTDKEDHRRQRRLMSHGFSHAAIKEQEPLVDKYVQKLFAQFRKDAELHQPTDMLKWYNLTTLDIIGDLVFGESFNCLDNGESELVDSIFNTIRIMSRVHAVLRMPLLSWARRLMISKKDALRHIEQKRVSKDKAERRIALGPAPEGRRDIMTNILRHNDEKGMSHAEILSNADGLIMAGSETTATALAGLTYCITTNPQALERVQREVREAFNSEKDIKINSTMSLKYLNACIEEAMRIYPPVAETPTRLSPGEFVNNHYIPKGWADYHNAANFALPEDFRPERWLSPDHPFHDPQFNTDKKEAFEPFSFGPRNCIGKNLAYAELRLIMAKFFWNFDFLLLPESHDWPRTQRAFTSWEKIPLMVQLKQVGRS
ncbi:cytochrome p450 3a17 [Stemphylium lycopersici]|uniref:Cytochrome p450 3a17 n=1 Tax=Stemphylium lycopersici TaxID=183478 RepID=A0A364MSR2_STELY|nr:cytochrome p450 3a17 [Stemphylium lycopersici]RAR00351.1 cytochrome p450 3a17 [Stemphylium lycopersici]RAR01909.1 cytochrome p450 3a17 [Stemphylium lycopersici]